MKFHRKSTALALVMVSTVLLVAGVVSASAQSGTNRTSPTFNGSSLYGARIRRWFRINPSTLNLSLSSSISEIVFSIKAESFVTTISVK